MFNPHKLNEFQSGSGGGSSRKQTFAQIYLQKLDDLQMLYNEYLKQQTQELENALNETHSWLSEKYYDLSDDDKEYISRKYSYIKDFPTQPPPLRRRRNPINLQDIVFEQKDDEQQGTGIGFSKKGSPFAQKYLQALNTLEELKDENEQKKSQILEDAIFETHSWLLENYDYLSSADKKYVGRRYPHLLKNRPLPPRYISIGDEPESIENLRPNQPSIRTSSVSSLDLGPTQHGSGKYRVIKY